MIVVKNLVKRYGHHLAVDRVSFSAAPGQVVGLLGPNGAGKSTLMRILAGYMTPTSGHAIIKGEEPAYLSVAARSRIGYLPERAALYWEMRVDEYLRYRARVKSVPSKKIPRRIEQAAEICGITAVRKRIIGQLSKGYRQRVALAAVLLHNPGVLILDEPTSGLDPLQMSEIRGLIRGLGTHRTVLFSTHLLAEAQAVCERVVMLRHGRVIADGTPAEIRRDTFGDVIHVEVAQSLAELGQSNGADFMARLQQAFPEAQVRLDVAAPRLRLTLAQQGATEPAFRIALAQALHENGATPIEIASAVPTLESLFTRVMESAGDP